MINQDFKNYLKKGMTENNCSMELSSVIDSLFSNNLETVNSNPSLNQCSPTVDVIMVNQGGICAKCNSMFKSKISLVNHLEKCGVVETSLKGYYKPIKINILP